MSRHLILSEVMTDLNLKVHGTGYDCSLEALDMKTAWTKVDLPNRNKPGTKIPTVPTSNFFFRLVPHKQLTRKLMKVQHWQSSSTTIKLEISALTVSVKLP